MLSTSMIFFPKSLEYLQKKPMFICRLALSFMAQTVFLSLIFWCNIKNTLIHHQRITILHGSKCVSTSIQPVVAAVEDLTVDTIPPIRFPRFFSTPLLSLPSFDCLPVNGFPAYNPWKKFDKININPTFQACYYFILILIITLILPKIFRWRGIVKCFTETEFYDSKLSLVILSVKFTVLPPIIHFNPALFMEDNSPITAWDRHSCAYFYLCLP